MLGSVLLLICVVIDLSDDLLDLFISISSNQFGDDVYKGLSKPNVFSSVLNLVKFLQIDVGFLNEFLYLLLLVS